MNLVLFVVLFGLIFAPGKKRQCPNPDNPPPQRNLNYYFARRNQCPATGPNENIDADDPLLTDVSSINVEPDAGEPADTQP